MSLEVADLDFVELIVVNAKSSATIFMKMFVHIVVDLRNLRNT